MQRHVFTLEDALTLIAVGYPDQPHFARDPAAILDERDAARLRARFAAVGGRYAQLAGLAHAGFSDAEDSAAVHDPVTGSFSQTPLGHSAVTPPEGVVWHRFPGPAA